MHHTEQNRTTLKETGGSHSQTRSYLESSSSTVCRFISVLLSRFCKDCTFASRSSSAPLLEQVHMLHSIGTMQKAKVIFNSKKLVNVHEDYLQRQKQKKKKEKKIQ